MQKCPDCGNADVAKVSFIYASQTSTVNTTTGGGGVGFGDGGLGVGVGTATTTGTIQSLQAQGVAPPKKPSNVGVGCATYIGIFLLYMIVLNPLFLTVVEKDSGAHSLLGFATLIGGALAVVAWTSARTKEKTTEWQAKMEAWSKMWMCLRCGKVFNP